MTESRWVRTWEYGIEFVENLDGIDWADAPRPWRWHRCWAQTRALLDMAIVGRCPCGATQVNGSVWIDRNSRR